MPGRGRALDLLELSRADLARPIREYSRGMRQKLGIVQAVQHEPELLVLDEPTEGLDPIVQEAFYELVRERRDAGATVLFSSHVLSEVEDAVRASRHDPRRSDDHGAHPLRDAGRATQARSHRVRRRLPRPRTSSSRERCASSSTGRVLRLSYSGEPSALVHALAAERIVDLEIEKASLEGIFLSLYRADEPGARPGRTSRARAPADERRHLAADRVGAARPPAPDRRVRVRVGPAARDAVRAPQPAGAQPRPASRCRSRSACSASTRSPRG